MKKILFCAGIFIGLQANLFAIHNLIFRSAGDINSGTLGNARLDPSSVTLQGNAIRLTDLAYSTSILTGAVTSYASAIGVSLSTLSLFTGGTTVYASAVGVSLSTLSLFTGGTTVYASAVGVSLSTLSLFTGGTTVYASALATAQSTSALESGSSWNANIVLSSHIVNETISSQDIGVNVILSTNIFDGGVTGTDILDATVESIDIFDGTITGADIANQTIGGGNITARTLNNNHILSSTITANEISSNTITAEKIAENTITGSEISSNSLTGEQLASNTITGVDISSTAILRISSATADVIIVSSINAIAPENGIRFGNVIVSSGIRVTGIPNCDTVNTDASGNQICGTDATGAAVVRSSAVIVGPLGASGVDVASNTIDGWEEALRMLNSGGLTDSTTGFGTIIYNPGVYSLSGATVPAGIKLIGTSSSVWVTDSVSNRIATIYGTVDGMQFDAGGRNLTSSFIVFRTGTRFKNNITYGTWNITASAAFTYTFFVGGETTMNNNIIIEKNTFKDWRPVDGELGNGDDGAFSIRKSSNVFFIDNKVEIAEVTTTGAGFVIDNSTNIYISRNDFTIDNNTMLNMRGSNADIFIDSNRFYQGQIASPNGNGIGIVMHNTNGVGTSTGALIISNNHFIRRFSGSGGVIDTLGGGTNTIDGISIKDNTVSCFGSANDLFINLVANVRGTVIKGNTLQGCGAFISDSGAGTVYTTNDNFKNSVEQ